MSRLALRALFLTAGAVTPQLLRAQIPPMPRIQYRESAWWFSGAAVAVQLGDIVDGRSQTRWSFGNDPLWQVRGSLEHTIQQGAAVGVAVAYGDVDLYTSPISALAQTPDGCTGLCKARTKLWTTMATFRAGGARQGFGSSIEGGAGLTGFTSLRSRDTNQPIPGFTNTWDFTAVLGGGLSYGFSDDFQLTLSQDFGIGFHNKTNLPDRTPSTFHPRSTRIGLRYGLGR